MTRLGDGSPNRERTLTRKNKLRVNPEVIEAPKETIEELICSVVQTQARARETIGVSRWLLAQIVAQRKGSTRHH
jgi:hypothetical protein